MSSPCLEKPKVVSTIVVSPEVGLRLDWKVVLLAVSPAKGFLLGKIGSFGISYCLADTTAFGRWFRWRDIRRTWFVLDIVPSSVRVKAKVPLSDTS